LLFTYIMGSGNPTLQWTTDVSILSAREKSQSIFYSSFELQRYSAPPTLNESHQKPRFPEKF
jgi:hypothetical protein